MKAEAAKAGRKEAEAEARADDSDDSDFVNEPLRSARGPSMSVVSSSQSWGDAPTSLTTSAAARKVSRTREGQEERKATQRDDYGEEDGGSHDNVNDMTEGEIYEAREGYGPISIGGRLSSVERRKIEQKEEKTCASKSGQASAKGDLPGVGEKKK